jgi:deoxyadenosine/deoxycytidine kinase
MWYSFEGNIGSGKSTILTKLSELPNIEIILEPLKVWESITNEYGETLFELYYKNPKEYGYLFQECVYKTRLQATEHEQLKDIRITERCVLTDKNIFMKTMIQNKIISEIQSKCYDNWYNWLSNKFSKPDKIIYLRTDVDICLERIKKRSRSGENNISKDFIQQLHNAHDEWLINNSDVIIINGNHSITDILSDIKNNIFV